MLQGLISFPSFGFDLKEHIATIYDSGTEPVSCTTIASIGKAVAVSLKKPKETKNRWLRISDTYTNQVEILSALEKETGKTWKKLMVSTEDVVKDARTKMAQGDFIGGYLGFMAVQFFTEGAGRSIVCTADNSDNDLLGVVVENTDSVVKRVILETSSTEKSA